MILTNFEIDILALIETWLTRTIENVCVSIYNYNMSRLDRQSQNKKAKGGGLMVYAKKKFKPDDAKYRHLNQSNSNIELQLIELSKSNLKTIILINAYRPPSGMQAKFVRSRTTYHCTNQKDYVYQHYPRRYMYIKTSNETHPISLKQQ